MAPSSGEPPALERTRSTRRGLKRFDTTPFTLQSHCGTHAAAVRDCLKKYKLENIDPTTLEERGWDVAPACKKAWDAYRQCGLSFFTATDWAQTKCAAEAEAFRACSPLTHGEERCSELELAMTRCTTTKIKMRMSGKMVPDDAS